MSWRWNGAPLFSSALGKFRRPDNPAKPKRDGSQLSRPPLHRLNVGWFRSAYPFPRNLGKKRMRAIRKGKKRVHWAPPGSQTHRY